MDARTDNKGKKGLDVLENLVKSFLGARRFFSATRPNGPQGGSRRQQVNLDSSAQKSNRASTVDVDRFKETSGLGQDWARTVYGDYFATSVPIHAAIKIRSEALARAPLVVYRPAPARSAGRLANNGHRTLDGLRRDPDGRDENMASHPPDALDAPDNTELGPPMDHLGLGEDSLQRSGRKNWVPAGANHAVQQLLDRVNPWYTRGELWRATEIYLCLWGSAFWTLERDEAGRREIWPLRPDRMRVLPDKQKYIRGYVYFGLMGPVAYTPEEVLWLKYFNPLEEYAGLSLVVPLRLSADMGLDALKFNRSFFRNSAQPDMIFTTDESMTDEEVENFYQHWEKRYKGPGNAHRPAIASFIKDIKPLGFSHREMEFIQGLRWNLEDVSRIYGVPMPLLSDLQRATFANINTAERLFWRNTMIPEMKFLEEQLNEKLLPQLGYPDLRAEFDLSAIEALADDENRRVAREAQMLDRGVLTINEVRRQRNMFDVPWGHTPWSKSGGRGSTGANPEASPDREPSIAGL